MKHDEIDKILHSKLYNVEPSVDAPPWHEFQRMLHPKPRVRKWHYYATTAAAAAVIAVVLWLAMPQNESTGMPFYQAELKPDSVINESSMLVGQPSAIPLSPATTMVRKESDKLAVIQLIEETATTKVLEFEDIKDELNPQQPVNTPEQPTQPIQQQKDAKYYERFKEQDYTIDTKPRGMLAFSAYTTIPSQGNNGNLIQRYDASVTPGLMSVQMGQYRQVVDFSNSEMTHKFPIAVGATVAVPIGKGFAIESGLNYTYLESTASTQTDYTYKYIQSVHYLGIPVAVTYRIAGGRALDFYASAGAMAEIAISSKGKTEVYSYEGNYLSNDTKHIDAKGVQISFNAALGLNVHLTKHVGIYVEPGVSHFIRNSNQPTTVRTESALRFNLRAGFKFQF